MEKITEEQVESWTRLMVGQDKDAIKLSITHILNYHHWVITGEKDKYVRTGDRVA